MANYRLILRLHSLGNSQCSIARDVQSSRDTVAEVIKAADAAGIAWPLDDDVTNEDIQEFCSLGSMHTLPRTPCLITSGFTPSWQRKA